MPKALTRIEIVRRSPSNPDVLEPVGIVEVPTCGLVKVILHHLPIGGVQIESSEVRPNEQFEDARNELEGSLARLNSAIEEQKTAAQHAMTDMYQFHKWTVSE